MAGLLLDAGADIEAIQGGGDGYGGGTYGGDRFKPIDRAIWSSQFWTGPNEDWKMVGYLLARGAHYSITIAAATGDMARVRQLLGEDAELVNDAQPCGRNPLSASVQFGQFDIAKTSAGKKRRPKTPRRTVCAARHGAKG